jgi:chromosome segregation ATPase
MNGTIDPDIIGQKLDELLHEFRQSRLLAKATKADIHALRAECQIGTTRGGTTEATLSRVEAELARVVGRLDGMDARLNHMDERLDRMEDLMSRLFRGSDQPM